MRTEPRLIGAVPGPDGTRFAVWAAAHSDLAVVVDGAAYEVERDDAGYFTVAVPTAAHGSRYRFRSADGALLPDPASRFQPDGPHGASMVVDPSRFPWSDAAWAGPSAGRQVIYEMHIGTFTREGTWQGAAQLLDSLAELGVTIIEVLPVAEFPGRWNWGYDGVALFAPAHVYGTPDDMRAFVDTAHACGIAVILDVVYNHLGPDGNYLAAFSPDYFSRHHTTDWGEALNFDERNAEHVRSFFLANAEYWIRDFHLDGLRFDATQNIYDAGPAHILTELVERARAAAAPRRIWTVSENEPQDVRMVRSAGAGGHGMDAVWNDDFHHTAMVALTGVTEAYYLDYGGTPQEFISCARHGFLYQGQRYAWQRQRRGTSTRGLPGAPFVNFIQNHDQIANSDSGLRLHELTSPALLRTLTAVMMLIPGHIMLFQGQEFASSSRFLFFADHERALARKVHTGRREFLQQFRSTALLRMQQRIHDPNDPATFELCVIDHTERASRGEVLALHGNLIRLALHDPVLAHNDRNGLEGTVLGANAFALRYDLAEGVRLLVVNLGRDLRLARVPHPVLAAPSGQRWRTLFTTEHPDYGGRGGPEPEDDEGRWHLVARSATLLEPGPEKGSL
jgi:maltooligosyltrehalose trehalohydrolase